MGRPAKIRKKKSFMFTTRHYSFMSIMGILLGIMCIGIVTTMVVHTYYNAGKAEEGFGAIGLFSVIINIIGILCGVSSLGERDIYVTPAIVAIVVNAVTILTWIVMIIISVIG